MRPVEQELSKAYQHLPDFEIASLYVQFDSLTEAARKALSVEIQRRGLAGPQLEKMHANEVRREEGFDRREKVRRKGWRPGFFFGTTQLAPSSSFSCGCYFCSSRHSSRAMAKPCSSAR
jgi:hypothetical protein